jgi:GNAT superfamily N-acetyltransferase
VSYLPPRPLEERDDVDNFHSQSNEQTSWLIRHAKQSAASNSTKVFVVTQENERHVVAYYAWTMAHLHLSDAPARLTKGAGRYPQPVALLARLAVDDRHVGYGLGAGLLADVIARFILIGGEIGCRGLLIHAESEEARRFYMHLVPELETSPTDRLHLVLLLKDAQQTLRHRA